MKREYIKYLNEFFNSILINPHPPKISKALSKHDLNICQYLPRYAPHDVIDNYPINEINYFQCIMFPLSPKDYAQCLGEDQWIIDYIIKYDDLILSNDNLNKAYKLSAKIGNPINLIPAINEAESILLFL